MKIRIVFWDVLPCKMIVDRRFRGAYCLHQGFLMMVDNYFTRQYIAEDNSEHHTRRRENLKSHIMKSLCEDFVPLCTFCNPRVVVTLSKTYLNESFYL
jgi:hypothetical protein